MKLRPMVGAFLFVVAIGSMLPAGVHAEPPEGAPPVTGMPVGTYIRFGAGSWYDTLYGSLSYSDSNGHWQSAINSGTPQTTWLVINVTGADAGEAIHGDLWRYGSIKTHVNGITATLWADRNQDGRFGPASSDGAYLAQDTTHCTNYPNFCGDYSLYGSDGTYARGITLEVGTPPSGTAGYEGWLWYE